MLSLIEQVSYHILIVLLPFIVYHLFIREEKQFREKINSKLLYISLTILILTMSNPIEFSEGFLYDFRVIPILFLLLYGGVKPGITLIIIMFLFRFSIGGAGLYVTLINYTLLVLFFVVLTAKFQPYTLRRRLLVISLLCGFSSFNRMITLTITGQLDQLSFMFIFSILTWITLIILIFIIENLDKQIIFDKRIQSAERLNLVSQIAASVAHEVRNPMTSIKGFLQLIFQEKNLNESQYRYIEISLSELERAEDVINDYLSLAKPTSIEDFSELNVTAELHSMLDIITSYTNSNNIAIESNIQEGILTKGKKSEFKQAILNIMKNSVEAINKNGTLTVRAYQLKSNIYIEIADNGIGMSKEQVELLGTPYYSTKDKGTGVGLALTYKIIRDMKGKITVQSEKGVGTTFIIKLPFL
ncbi:ATP-binding protein [Cytobacillus sp. FJAT-54145]|uniref:histidine kinase n=1 Tax=Cytobacillus spartinae TaxID=3299023 RepID=A0ABW6K7R4_9BACI